MRHERAGHGSRVGEFAREVESGLTSANASPKRARYFRSRSASFELCFFVRDTAKSEPSRVAQAARARLTDAEHVLELDAVEAIELRAAAEHARRARPPPSSTAGSSPPSLAQPRDLLVARSRRRSDRPRRASPCGGPTPKSRKLPVQSASRRRREVAGTARGLLAQGDVPPSRAVRALRARTRGSARCPRAAREARAAGRSRGRCGRAGPRGTRPRAHGRARSRLVPAMSWKSLRTSRSEPTGKKRLLLDRAQQHRLLVEAELADLVEEEHAAVRRAQEPRPRRRARR